MFLVFREFVHDLSRYFCHASPLSLSSLPQFDSKDWTLYKTWMKIPFDAPSVSPVFHVLSFVSIYHTDTENAAEWHPEIQKWLLSSNVNPPNLQTLTWSHLLQSDMNCMKNLVMVLGNASIRLFGEMLNIQDGSQARISGGINKDKYFPFKCRFAFNVSR